VAPKKRSERRFDRKKSRRHDHAPLLQLVAEQEARQHKRPARREIAPLTEAQRLYDSAIFANQLVFGVGPAGTGKTWWAATRAAEQLADGKIDKIIVTRPAIEAGENLGFLPGNLEEKYEPYFRPVRDALEETLGTSTLDYMLKAGTIEVRPLAFLRGATFKNCWVLADEMQNTTPAQMKMFLTRIGQDCTAIVNGDPTQTDIIGRSGLVDAVERLEGLKNVATITFERKDIVRSGLCQEIAERYEVEGSRPHAERYSSDDSASGVRRILSR
jgi:phosphate starvation-inducible PhoH-like protein